MITEPPRSADLTSSPSSPRTPSGPRRQLAARRALPSGRALVGGLLVASAAVASIAMAQSSGAPDTVPVVVAAELLEPGTALGPERLRVVEMELPEALVSTTYGDVESLEGTVARSRIEPDELLQRGDVIESTAAQRAVAPAREFSLRVETDRVVDGRIEAGDRVDVLATYGTGPDARTVMVLANARVLDTRRNDDSLRSSGSLVVTLALAERDDTIALAHAVDVASVTLVRTTTAEESDPPAGPYSLGDDTDQVDESDEEAP